MMKKIRTFFSFIVIAALLSPAAYAGQVMVSDVQIISVGEKDFILRITSNGAQAFDVIKQPSKPLEIIIRLYQAKLGAAQQLGVTPFGSVTMAQTTAKQVEVRIVLKDPAFRPQVKQGDSPNTVEARITWAPDVTAPVISAVKSSALSTTGATLTWTTDEASSSQVLYGTAQPETQSSTLDKTLVTSHSVTLTGLTAGKTYYFRVRSADSSGNTATSNSAVFTTASPAFKETGGQVVIEAEHFDGNVTRGGKTWTLQTTQAGYAGSGFMTALPNNNGMMDTGYVTTSPELVYNINFATTGTYYVWLRGRGPTGSDDSVHAGLNKAGPSTADRITGFTTAWAWSRATSDGPVATLVVSKTGLQSFHLWMREDGFQVDRIILRTNNSATAPAGPGPVESSRA